MSEIENRIENQERRIDRLEDELKSTIEKIFNRLDGLSINLAKQSCPDPGACIQLANSLAEMAKSNEKTASQLARCEEKLLAFERDTMHRFHKIDLYKAKIMGGWSVVAFLAAIIGTLATLVIDKLI